MTIHVTIHKEIRGGAGGANAAPGTQAGTYRYLELAAGQIITIADGEKLARVWGDTAWRWADGRVPTAADPIWPANLPQDLMVYSGQPFGVGP